MLITPHALTGATIAVLVPNPLISLPLAIGSHFVLDSIPHWQETLYPYDPTRWTWVRVVSDLGFAVFLIGPITASYPQSFFLIWIATLAATIPDLDSVALLIPRLLKIKLFKSYWDWHCRIQKETSSPLGLIPQLVVVILGLLISLREPPTPYKMPRKTRHKDGFFTSVAGVGFEPTTSRL